MRYIKGLTKDTIKLLKRIYKQSKYYQVRQRSHCILLSYEKYKISELIAIFKVSRNTIYNWLNNCENLKLVGLYNREGRGRKKLFDPLQQEKIKAWVKESPKRLTIVQEKIQGWFSTHPTTGYSGSNNSRFKDASGNPFQHLIELWVNAFGGVQAPSGNQFAELNAQANSALYQDIVVFSGETIPWTVSHRGRQEEAIADIAEVFISDPNDWTGATFSGEKLYYSTGNHG